MANTHLTLTSLFTDIANAIRNKTGNTGKIVADNFPNAINNIPTGKQIYDLGTNTTFNVKTICEQNGIDYTNLTANDFYIGETFNGSVSLGNASVTIYATTGSGKGSANLIKTYNKSTGVLSLYVNLKASYLNVDEKTNNISVHAYLIV